MRWKICKALKKLPSDEEINNLTNLEIYWLGTMISKDEEEEFNRRRDELEYLASFSNYEAVQKVRDLRQGKNMVTKTSDEDFASLVSELSGRAAPEFQNQE